MKSYFLKRITLLPLLMVLISLFAMCKDDNNQSVKDEEQAALVKLKVEIDQMANQESCSNATDWKFVAIGSKACGGPTGYVAYSTKINETKFLEKVTNYTNQQKAFNTKWGIASDCMLVSKPNGVVCSEGKPVLIYNN